MDTEPDSSDRARVTALVGTALWLVLVPTVVGVLIPWLITGWNVDHELPGALRAIGAMVAALGAAVFIDAFIRFPLEGLGTPVPFAPTARLVVGGPYRRVRNPMYLAGLAVIVGQALLFGSLPLAVWAAGVAAWFAGFVHLYEEPALSERYGAQYEHYREAVPRWLPRVRPWDDSGPDEGDRGTITR
jgi:protein-S-isoprenylcysteine O-methyltransferase Ste14